MVDWLDWDCQPQFAGYLQRKSSSKQVSALAHLKDVGNLPPLDEAVSRL